LEQIGCLPAATALAVTRSGRSVHADHDADVSRHRPRRERPAMSSAHDHTAWAERARLAYAAMQARFGAPDGGFRRDGGPRLPATRAHLWPFTRALVATLDLAGATGRPTDRTNTHTHAHAHAHAHTHTHAGPHADPATGRGLDATVGRLLAELERYWDPGVRPPGYASDPPGRWRRHPDLYHDDNAWVGLALVQLERMRSAGLVGAGLPVPGRATQLYELALAGWDDGHEAGRPHPGGIFWARQSHGLGRRNHDRNTVSTAPNAALGLHLAELGAGLAQGPVGPVQMHAWITAALDQSRAGDEPGTGLFEDKIRGDGSVDATLWSYNQGSMIGLGVLLSRAPATRGDNPASRAPATRGDDPVYLARAEAIARRTLRHYGEAELDRQPPAFNAILFRNLLQLRAASADGALGAEIDAALRGAAGRLWRTRDGRDLVVRAPRRPTTLLDQSAAVSLLALCAWDPGRHALLA
jgi:hypothetical protein